jgi:hypothetical protein
MGKIGRPRKASLDARCLEHHGSAVIAYGSRSSKSGLVRRFLCTPSLGVPHTFSVTVEKVGTDAPPPPCEVHLGSKVVRNGSYGVAMPKLRQRYKCSPADGSKSHTFTPPLPRDHVHSGEEHCEHCDELRGIHRGETAVARRHSWSTRVVARGLEQLAGGATYADVSRWAIRVTGTQRTRMPAVRPPRAKPKKKVSPRTREIRNAWHIAAD